MLTPDGGYFNFSGCGNTLNCNNPNVRDMIVESLRYWVTDYHIDGFRFDLAAILGRDQNGNPRRFPLRSRRHPRTRPERQSHVEPAAARVAGT